MSTDTHGCRARDVEIAGKMTGELICENLLIAKTGGFEGTINCGRLAAESGCVVDANVQMSGSDDLPEISLLEGAGASIPGLFQTAIAEQQDRSAESQSTE
jgi:cytoskeletal protein CcmA (bactofilin family)